MDGYVIFAKNPITYDAEGTVQGERRGGQCREGVSNQCNERC